MSFFNYFFEAAGYILNSGENQVLCPFPHVVAGDVEHSETRPSASVNLDKGLYHCMACGRGGNEVQFIEQYFGCDKITAKKLADCFRATNETIAKWDENDDDNGLIDVELPLNEETRKRAHALGISDTAIKKMHIKTHNHSVYNNIMAFPIDMFGAVLDHKYYHPYDETHPKTTNSKKFWTRGGCPNGLVYPWRVFEETPKDRILCICAGEKDVANMLSRGLNAVTITGGENTYKVVCPNLFKGRKIAILYDNDQAGKDGARKLATYLHSFGCERVRVVEKHHEICTEKGEDITDFFNKYEKNVDDLKKIIADTPYFVPESTDYENIKVKEQLNLPIIQENAPIITLYQATLPKYEGKLVKSLVQIVASEDIAYSFPLRVTVRKFKPATKVADEHWTTGQFKDWALTAQNCEEILYLVDENFSEKQIMDNIKTLVKADKKEDGIKVEVHERGAAFRAVVQDFIEDKSIEFKPVNYNALVLDEKLDSGKKYMITYKVVAHPYKGAKKTMVVFKVEDAEDSITRFRLTRDVVENLMQFQNKTTEQILKSFAPRIGFTPNLQLFQTVELNFHSVLQFYLTNQFNKPQLIRGTLETLIIAESRVGKSASTKACIESYGLGQIVSLAGKSATINGLIGGSVKVGVSDRYATKAGVLPMNHKGLVVLEEFGKATGDLMRELTDIRSSNRVRITRVDSTIDLPCMLRTIYLTNPKSRDGEVQSIESFPNGIEIVTGLVAAPEDIARFDNICIIGDKANVDYTKFEEVLEEYSIEAYRDRIRWIWSRTPEQIIIPEESDILLRQLCNKLNAQYETHIKIFGTELRQKIARIAVALAGYHVSTDDSFETIRVLPEHISEAVEYFKNLYDNSTFKIMRYVNDQKLYSEFTEEGLGVLNTAFNKPNGASLLYALDQRSVCTLNELMANTGLDRDKLNGMLQPLLKTCLVQFVDQNKIKPTEKYRRTRPKVTSTRIREVFDERGGVD